MIIDINTIISVFALLISAAAIYFSRQEKNTDYHELLIKLSADVSQIKESLVSPIAFGVLQNKTEVNTEELSTVRDRVHGLVHDVIKLNAKDIK